MCNVCARARVYCLRDCLYAYIIIHLIIIIFKDDKNIDHSSMQPFISNY